jgi:asparagine synthase (glutamine-hydrolysing)
MCGITGWIDWDGDLTREADTIERMTDSLTQRGPDARGTFLSRCAALGHRRLTVIDPEGGKQPMTRQYGEKRWTIVYNGELYNTDEMRSALAQCGHHFTTRSDTEVLLLSYIEWGIEALERLNGIFAFGIWSEHDRELLLVRDRLGVKPLFYTVRGGKLLFGSELKALLAHPSVEPVLDEEGLAELFCLGPSRTPGHGVFTGVEELRPGDWLRFDPNGMQVRPYWRLISQPHTDNLDQTAETVRRLLVDSVERQLVSDVPIGTLLSGGLDSSVITAIASRAFQRDGRGPLHTWSVDYRDNDRHFKASAFQPNADAPWIKRVSGELRTHHHDVLIDTPELVEALTAAMRARDLPGMADIDASLYLFCREIKKEFTVMLSGECADEMFGGYPWFHRTESLADPTFPWIRSVDERLQLLKPGLFGSLDPRSYLSNRYQQTLAEVPSLPGEEPLEAKRRAMFYLNLTWFMATLLDRKDRMSMAAGLEARVPFCDHRLMEYVWNIPWAMKMHGGREKGILRLAMEGWLPEEVLYRKKSPYPKTHHPAYAAAVREWVLTLLADRDAPLHQVVDAEQVRQLARADSGANRPWFGQLMGTPQLFAYLGQLNTWLGDYQVRLH